MSARSLRLGGGFLPLLLLVAACDQPSPTAPTAAPVNVVPALTRLECTVRVSARRVVCTDASLAGRGNLLVGAPFVSLESSNVAYDADSAVLSADVTLSNHMPQPMGTADGVNADTAGSQVFFHSGPTVTGGEGLVTVRNPDLVGTYTSAGQPAFRYPGIIPSGGTSAAREWRFNVPTSVQSFVFTLFVQSRLPDEAGWIDIAPSHPVVAPGHTLALSAVVYAATGGQLRADSLHWSSSDTTRARIGADGVVTGIAPGTTTITAVSGRRSGQVLLTVDPGDHEAPTLVSFSFSPTSVDVADSSANVLVHLALTDDSTGVATVGAELVGPSGGTLHATNCQLTSGSERSGGWDCVLRLARYAGGGDWVVSRVSADDHNGNLLEVGTAELTRRGFPTLLHVTSAARSLPYLTELRLLPDSVDVRVGPRAVDFGVVAGDSVNGVASVAVTLTSPSGTRRLSESGCTRGSGDEHLGEYSCTLTVPQYAESGLWGVSIDLESTSGGTRSYSPAKLDSLALPSHVKVVAQSDSEAPTLEWVVRFSPDTVEVTDSLPGSTTTTVQARDNISGVHLIAVFLANAGGTAHAAGSCTLSGGIPTFGEFTCTIEVPEGSPSGIYDITLIRLTDFAGNVAEYDGEQLRLSGFPTSLTVLNTTPAS